MSMIKQIPSHLLNDAMEAMIGNNSYLNQTSSSSTIDTQTQIQKHTEKEARTVTALQTMIEWLCERPSELLAENLRKLCYRLSQCNRNSVLIEITHGTLEKLLLTLPSSHLQNSTENLFFFLLLGFQHSETVFHQIVTVLPIVFKGLMQYTESKDIPSSNLDPPKTHTQMKSMKILNRLKESVHFLIIKFPGFPQIYSPLYDWLDQNYELPKNRIDELESLSWLSGYNTEWISNLSQVSASPLYALPSTKNIEESVSNTYISATSMGIPSKDTSQKYSQKQRSATGMVGLINLGNTCYMNSVLQALYMTDMFRELVFTSPVQTSTNNMLDKLQQTFAFLKNTMRAIYSPSGFLKVARPPWFESGRQQDCSEFLRYLLDCLHEQEKSQKGEVVVYGEHHVIEPKKDVCNIQPLINDDNEDFAQTPTNDIPENIHNSILLSAGQLNNLAGSGKGVRASISTTALDSISEAPEMIETDEDMISQGSAAVQGEDLLFGSRGSLSIDQNKHIIEPELSDDSSDDNGNAMGSRDSLGLTRWTTEENLSFGGSKEKMDLIDGATINDSHSNSTDSGIQSVGDSIRGSSDSMSNHTPPNLDGNNGVLSSGSLRNPVDPFNKPNVIENISTQQKEPFVSLVQKVFGGKMQTSYQCYNCMSISVHKEYFTDFLLAFPDPKEEITKQPEEKDLEKNSINDVKEGAKPSSGTEKSNISIQQLINLYLNPEMLTGENQYHCDKCKCLQDGIKTMEVLEGPEHLMCTLMRFKYDRTLNRKSKVFTGVSYDFDLNIPVTKSEENSIPLNIDSMQMKKDCNKELRLDDTLCNVNDRGKQANLKIGDEKYHKVNEKELYKLYAIVVHSGYSSDGGHYFTYAKVPKKPGMADSSDCVDDLWYIFNDSKVTYSNFETFLSHSKKFPVDTAYVLFYQKINSRVSTNSELSQSVKAPLRNDLKMVVDRDNIKFMREKERSAIPNFASSSSSIQGNIRLNIIKLPNFNYLIFLS